MRINGTQRPMRNLFGRLARAETSERAINKVQPRALAGSAEARFEPNDGSRYVLCRPLGGLNDAFNQIEKCIRYCERFSRVLVIDFSDNPFVGAFLKLLDPIHSSIRIVTVDSNASLAFLDSYTTFPPQIRGRLSNYRAIVLKGKSRSQRFDESSGVRLSFDFNHNYDESVLVHHQEGGGKKSFGLLQRLSVSDEILDQALQIVPQLPERYVSIHIRNSDYRTNYKWVLSRAIGMARGRPLLLLSDSDEVIRYAKSFFPEDRLLCFPLFGNETSQAIHRIKRGVHTTSYRDEALRLLAEIVAVSSCEKFFYSEIDLEKPKKFPVYSGFSILAAFIVKNRNRIPLVQGLQQFPERIASVRVVLPAPRLIRHLLRELFLYIRALSSSP